MTTLGNLGLSLNWAILATWHEDPRAEPTWGDPGWANVATCGMHICAEYMRNICGTDAEHMRNSRGAIGMASGQPLLSNTHMPVIYIYANHL